MSRKETPVLLLTGYLGSGKTTLVNHILSNKKGIKFAVIVNDIGEVNIDADLIQKGGVVGKKDESLVALQNGCICCTLKMDLIEQLNDIKLSSFLPTTPPFWMRSASMFTSPISLTITANLMPFLFERIWFTNVVFPLPR